MCLAVPMQITVIDGLVARCEAKGVERTASLFLLQDEGLVPGDFVVIHAGHAIQKISAEDAHAAWVVYDDMLAAEAAEAARRR